MPQVPDWKRPLAALRNDAEQIPSRVLTVLNSLAERGRVAVGRECPPASLIAVELPAEELATKQDLETQSRLARDRVSLLLKGFLETQRTRDEEFRETIRTELREELESFASAIGDGAFSATTKMTTPASSILDDDDLETYDEILFADDEFDVAEGEIVARNSRLDIDALEGNY
jgi:hypothetical protein